MPSQSNLRAAQAVVLSRQRLRRGLNRDAAGRRKKPLTLRAAEARYAGSARASIGRIVKRLEAANTVDYEDVVDPKMGRPRQLTDEEEEAIVCYIIWMEKSGLPASKWEIEDAALTLRRRRDPDARPVSKMWYSRFRDDHPELAKSILKSREASRAEYEEGGVDDTKEWFQRLSDVMTKYNIGASETWNADEAGVRVGMLRDKMECLVVRTKKKSATEVFSPQDRETCTVIGSGNAAGATTPPWLIFKSLPTLEWAFIEGDPDMRFAQSDSAFSSAAITLEWAKHFNRCSWEKSATVQQRQLDFEEWFGCNEHLQDTNNRLVTHDMPPAARPDDEALREALRKGNLTFGRRAFAGAFQEIFNEGFTAAHIISGFQKTGIYPPTDRPAIEYLLRKQLKKKKTFTPAHFSLLPSDMRFHAASSTAETIGERYHDILSSPTLAGLRHIRNIVHEAVVLEDVIKKYVDDRRTRIEKRYHERKRGRRAKTVSDLIPTVSLQDLRDQQEEAIADDKKKQHKQGIRFTRSVIIKEMNRLKDEWRENKEVIVNGIPKRLQFKQWLEHTGKQYDYLSMDTQRSQMTEALKEETDGYMIDTQLPDDVREAIRKAQYAAKPLSAVDLTGLPHSDDTVTFNLTQAHEHEEMDEEDEILPVIEVAGGSEVEMPSSPPCAPDSESSLPTLPSTPCPYQHHTQLHESLRDIIRGIRTAQEDSLIG
ncbi:hypothetical protein FLAG1_01447 [Fusarium langsethiae]|uniref:HTH CENPB-type domain-containing protein n=2 Tax=Fusarium sambucinum species complex TaxID=569360 RepID=A0A0N0DHL4_FUSLA|nr:hypothetical protein FLAG1_01447 [Fusarium langsethiae]